MPNGVKKNGKSADANKKRAIARQEADKRLEDLRSDFHGTIASLTAEREKLQLEVVEATSKLKEYDGCITKKEYVGVQKEARKLYQEGQDLCKKAGTEVEGANEEMRHARKQLAVCQVNLNKEKRVSADLRKRLDAIEKTEYGKVAELGVERNMATGSFTDKELTNEMVGRMPPEAQVLLRKLASHMEEKSKEKDEPLPRGL